MNTTTTKAIPTTNPHGPCPALDAAGCLVEIARERINVYVPGAPTDCDGKARTVTFVRLGRSLGTSDFNHWTVRRYVRQASAAARAALKAHLKSTV